MLAKKNYDKKMTAENLSREITHAAEIAHKTKEQIIKNRIKAKEIQLKSLSRKILQIL